MLRVKRLLSYPTRLRVTRRPYSSAFAEQWIKDTFFQRSATTSTPALTLRDLIIRAPRMDRKQIDESCESVECIIDQSSAVMGLPLIDFDARKHCDAILEGCALRPNYERRFKPLFATVRGMGGGKTRALEEIRRELLMQPDTLPLAITFNHLCGVTNDVWETELKPHNRYDPKLFLSLSIICRMASTLYNVQFTKVRRFVIGNIKELLKNRSIDLPEDLLRAFIKCMVEEVSFHREKPVTKFILLIDETMKIVKHIDKIYGPQNDIMSIVRGILLDECRKVRMRGGQEYELNTSLVLSSFEIDPLDKTSCGRPVLPIVLPASLNSVRICDEIFLKHRHTANLSAEDRKMFLLIAASLNELPRLVEYANRYVSRNELPQDKEGTKLMYYSGLYEFVCSHVKGMYRVQIDNRLLLYSIVFGIGIYVTKPVVDAITYSLITNSISEFDGNPIYVTPNTSLLMMYVASQAKVSRGSFLYKPLEKIFNTISRSKNAGEVLEVAVFEWLRVRLLTASAALKRDGQGVKLYSPDDSPRYFSASMLLSLDVDVSNLYGGVLERPLRLQRKRVVTQKVSEISVNSYKKSDSFIDELKSCEVNEVEPIIILKPAKGDAWDVGLKVFNAKDTANPIYVLINCKFADEPVEKKKKISYSGVTPVPGYGEQYLKMKTLCELHKVRFAYIYLSTHDIEGSSLLVDHGGTLIVMGREQSKSFLGPIFQLYDAARRANAQTVEK